MRTPEHDTPLGSRPGPLPPAWTVPLARFRWQGPTRFLRPARLAGLYAGFWALQLAVWLFAYHEFEQLPNPVETALFDAASWMVAGTLSMGVGFVLPRSRASARLFLAILAGAVALVLVRLLIIRAFAPVFGWQLPGLESMFISHLPRHLLITTSYVGLGCGLRGALRGRREDAQWLELDTALAESRLAALRTHLRPRTLLAALGSIAEECTADARAADARLMALGELLRLQLGRSGRATVPLRDELDFVSCCIELERACSTASIELESEVGPGAAAVPVPTNSVSILVESVLRVRPGPAAAVRMHLGAAAEGGLLRVTLRDTCPVPAARRGTDDWGEVRELRESLQKRFGSAFRLEFADTPEGAVARISLPLGPEHR